MLSLSGEKKIYILFSAKQCYVSLKINGKEKTRGLERQSILSGEAGKQRVVKIHSFNKCFLSTQTSTLQCAEEATANILRPDSPIFLYASLTQDDLLSPYAIYVLYGR